MEPVFREVLAEGLAALGISLPPGALAKLEAYADLLLRWNAKVNLTSVTGAAAVAELHLVDSLALLRVMGAPASLLDVGSGAGLPGIPLAIARPGLQVTCCDAVGKKAAFVKAAAAALDLPVRGAPVRAQGKPERERLPRCDLVVSRALADPARWVPLGAAYLAEGGRLVAMLGREAEEAALEGVARGCGLRLERVDRFALPRSGAARANALFARAG